MTTFPERQCQETINVCEKEVKVLWGTNCLVPQETRLKEPLVFQL